MPAHFFGKALLMPSLKPVKAVVTFDGRSHEVDMKFLGKSFTAWGFVDSVLIESEEAKSALMAVASWKREYREHFEPAN
jgi:hypothetical protein